MYAKMEICEMLKEMASQVMPKATKADGGSNRQLEVRTAVRTSSVQRGSSKLHICILEIAL